MLPYFIPNSFTQKIILEKALEDQQDRLQEQPARDPEGLRAYVEVGESQHVASVEIQQADDATRVGATEEEKVVADDVAVVEGNIDVAEEKVIAVPEDELASCFKEVCLISVVGQNERNARNSANVGMTLIRYKIEDWQCNVGIFRAHACMIICLSCACIFMYSHV
jgi:hypothetical protein